MTASGAPIRPVQLQVNTAGAWKTVLHFNASDDMAAAQVQEAVEVLYQVDQRTRWRITTCDRVPLVLRHLGSHTYGVWISRSEA
ncbi:MAG: hypothetical protein JSS18_01225 [Proteobacteria bacterium]|nr:hypothetical protein [Pseudomonadota bacterium]